MEFLKDSTIPNWCYIVLVLLVLLYFTIDGDHSRIEMKAHAQIGQCVK